MPTKFYKFSPSGNVTLFLEDGPATGGAAEGARALGLLGGEQAGFVNIPAASLRMAGGEFCVNAARAFGALLDMRSAGAGARRAGRAYAARISGCGDEIRLTVEGSLPSWRVGLEFYFAPPEPERLGPGLNLVRLPGISHLLLEWGGNDLPGPGWLAIRARELGLRHGLDGEACFGLVPWQKRGNALAIAPFVTVRAVGTAMLESACGSATLALAALLGTGGGGLGVLQPSGQTLAVSLEKCLARVCGSVELLAAGDMWP